MVEQPGILLTAFEPSGDDLGAAVIPRLRALRPGHAIWALGGPRMRAAGAEIIEETTDKAVMLAGAAAQAWEHRRRVRRLRQWLAGRRLAALVPIDSPAANWSICALIRACQPQARIVHLVAPQLWAWAPWRIGKLRRLTDRVLCLLPFEPAWFAARGVSAVFVGHPLFDPRRLDAIAAWAAHPPTLPNTPSPRLALLPGSRHGEIAGNWPIMLRVLAALRRERPDLQAAVAAVHPAAGWIREGAARAGLTGQAASTEAVETMSPGLHLLTGKADEVIAWGDAVLVASGTATLQVASHRKPMVAMYRVSPWSWHLAGRWIIQTRTFTLPNLIGEWQGIGRAIEELVPHFGAVPPVLEATRAALWDQGVRRRERAALEQVCAAFATADFADLAGREIAALVS